MSRTPAPRALLPSTRAWRRFRSGRARFVLVVGVEKMTGASREEVANNLLKASYVKEEAHIEGGFAGVFGLIAESYFQRHG